MNMTNGINNPFSNFNTSFITAQYSAPRSSSVSLAKPQVQQKKFDYKTTLTLAASTALGSASGLGINKILTQRHKKQLLCNYESDSKVKEIKKTIGNWSETLKKAENRIREFNVMILNENSSKKAANLKRAIEIDTKTMDTANNSLETLQKTLKNKYCELVLTPLKQFSKATIKKAVIPCSIAGLGIGAIITTCCKNKESKKRQ